MTRQAAAGGGAFGRSRVTPVFVSLLVARCLASPEARAGEGPAPIAFAAPEVRVDCPELAPEQIAAVEARQMSELLSQDAQGGTLLLVCLPDRVSGIWQEDGVTVESRFLSRNATDSAVELLHWLASVLLELRTQRQATPAGAGTSGAAAGAAIATQPLAPTADSPPAPAPPPSPAATEPRPPTDSVESPTMDAAAEPPAKPSSWTLALSATYAHFGTEIPGALGPRAAVSYRLLPRLDLVAATDVEIGLASSEGFGAFDVGFALGASCELFPFLALWLAPRLVLTTFSMPPNTTTGSSATVVAGGALLAVRGRLPLRPLSPFFDIGLDVTAPARRATLGEERNPVLTVPTWQGLFAMGVELSL